ncbi:Inner membrane protein ypdA [Slackia heliotrinireducens]|uniref:histidine kinase n=1 Tax=Slackia heliotrinireducens (strain ATCC 29202 / DSM 20476 / NCTC 11029 / RHS 1) TaxID=471855 RepID=C7N0N6_SLAHD|nr:histidine kinase [Slackia heliotrinireducens]ACV21114.1 putative regulator of cell autolysis [Slackia heliotrinireducens DSM 20476]VEH03627.1 Inner membrane protein ypdA [Slackia heliotrinireducens]
MTPKSNYSRFLELILLIMAATAAGGLIYALGKPNQSTAMTFASGLLFTMSLMAFIYVQLNPDAVRARQSDTTLKLASEMLSYVQDGMSAESAQAICGLLLPATNAKAVAITNREVILGYVGEEEGQNESGSPVRTKATHATLTDGKTRVLTSAEEIGFPPTVKNLSAGIVVPLHRGEIIVGTLKFYYRRASSINETQLALAEGLAELLSTQIAAVEMENQRKLATTMELKALQSQINPHFLFNTINTIAALTRTDPARARVLLREFAVFYRRTLENSDDLLEVTRELDQTQRYFLFEVARFGEDRLSLDVEIEDGLEDILVPSFLVQPLVENAVKHAMPQEGMLNIEVDVYSEGDDVIISVKDDGIGMDESQKRKMLEAPEVKGTGIAMGNIRDRLRGYYGEDAHMEVESSGGTGTTVRLVLSGAADDGEI